MAPYDNCPKYTRCFCFLEDQRPIKTEYLLGQWIPLDNEAIRTDIFKILPCGHSVHERCARLMNRLCYDLKKNLICPVCDPDWTRPRDFQQRMIREKGIAHIKFNPCVCSEVENIRTFKGPLSNWLSFDLDVFIYPCGHGFHERCLKVLTKALEKPKETFPCPLCEREWNPEKHHDEAQQNIVKEHLQLVQKDLQANQRTLAQIAVDWKKNSTIVIIGTLVGALMLLEYSKYLTTNPTKLPWLKTTIGDFAVFFLAVLVTVVQAKVWGMFAPLNRR